MSGRGYPCEQLLVASESLENTSEFAGKVRFLDHCVGYTGEFPLVKIRLIVHL